MGVGDVGAVSSRERSKRDSSGSGDTREQIGDRKHGDIIGRRNTQWAEEIKPRGHGVGVGDVARGEPGACGVHVDGAIRDDGVRGDGVGVGDVGAVPYGAGGKRGHAAGGDDGGGADGEHKRGDVG